MSDIHLHLHIPPGSELTFDGETLTCRPVTVEVTGDGKPMSIDLETLVKATEAGDGPA